MNFENTPGGKLVAEMRKNTQELFVVPNSWLPAELHDNVRGGRTLARLNELCEKRDGETAHRKLKALKAENVARYRAELEAGSEISYDGHRDDIQLHKNEMALVAGMVSGGIIDADDLLED